MKSFGTAALLLAVAVLAGPAAAQRPATTTPSSSMSRPPGGTPNNTPAQMPGQPTPGYGPAGRPSTQPKQPSQTNSGTAANSASSSPYGQYPAMPGVLPTEVPMSATPGPTDTLHVDLDQALTLFIQRNYNLIAQRFNVNLAQAAVIQSGLRDNPNISVGANAYNPAIKTLFPFGAKHGADVPENNGNATGNTVNIQVQQLINLSHSRAKLVQLSSTNAEVQQAAFEDLMRTGRYQLLQTFYNVIAERRRLLLLQQQRDQLDRLLVGFQEQLRLGTVAGFEVTRLELERESLEKDHSDQLVQLGGDEAALRVFLATPGTTFVAPEGQPLLPDPPATLPTRADLTTLAYQARPDLRAATRQTTYAQQNLRLQKALAVPKVAVGASYASYGSTYANFYMLQAAMDVPVFNRNQGNVQAAQVGIQQSGNVLSQVNLQVEQDVAAAVEQLQHATDLRRRVTPRFVASIQDVSRNATRDYQLRLIDLVSFIDKIRAYKDAQMHLIDVGNRLELAKQQVNYVTNTPVFTN
jgi:cobalt-zinc-cadmium efflux system outer membrane protein